MNTPAHLLIGAAVFGKRDQRRLVWAALLGSLLPDLSLYLLAGGAMYLFAIPPARVFNELYFSDAWQTIFAVDNSFLVWGVLLALALWWRSGWCLALTAAAILHLALDFPLHHDDGRAHFWPLSGWIFASPVSYWDIEHGARWIAPVEATAAVIAALRLWAWRPGRRLSVLVLILLSAEIWIVRQWLFYFIDS